MSVYMSFPCFIIHLFVFILLNFKSSLYILHTSPLSNILFENIFPLCILFVWPVKRVLYDLLKESHAEQMFLILIKFNFWFFLFYGNFPVKSKITSPYLGPEDFLRCFLFYFLWLTFYIYDHDLKSRFFLFFYSSTICWKGYSSVLNFLLLFSHPVMSNSLRLHGLQYARPPCLSPSWSLPKFMSITLVMPSSHLILWCPLLLLPSIFSSIRDFSNESAVWIRWPKYWSFIISPSNEYSELISLKIDWFDLFAVQETLRSLLQHDSSKASILSYSTLFMDLQSKPYVTTGRP